MHSSRGPSTAPSARCPSSAAPARRAFVRLPFAVLPLPLAVALPLAVLLPGLAACRSADAPLPRGVAYAVGVTTRTFVDASRPTPANGDEPAKPARTLPTEIWYPAASSASGSASDPAIDELRDVPVAPGGPFGLVLFVHGSSGFRRQSTYLTRALAADGWVVAAADFPLTSFFTAGGPSDRHVDEQHRDLAFLADSLERLSGTAGELLQGAVRAGTYAVVGHSTGGTIALVAAYAPDLHDPRVKAVAALAPCACFFGEGFFATRAVPLLAVAGTADLLVPYAPNARYAYEHAGAPAHLALLAGGTHLSFTDFSLQDDPESTPTTNEADIARAFLPYGGGTACDPSTVHPTDPPLGETSQRRLTVDLVRAHLDIALRGGPPASLATAAASDPRVTLRDRWSGRPPTVCGDPGPRRRWPRVLAGRREVIASRRRTPR